MSNQIRIEKTIYGLTSFNNVVDTNFSELIPSSRNQTSSSAVTVDTLFRDYSLLYFDIPVSGSDNSHISLAQRSLERVGLSLEDLQSEIESLREENISLKNQILTISNINVGDLANL